MRRMIVTLELTAAQAAFLRGAIRSFLEDNPEEGRHRAWADTALVKLSQPLKEVA